MTKKGTVGSRLLKYVTAGAAAGVLLFSSLVPRLIPLTAERSQCFPFRGMLLLSPDPAVFFYVES